MRFEQSSCGNEIHPKKHREESDREYEMLTCFEAIDKPYNEKMDSRLSIITKNGKVTCCWQLHFSIAVSSKSSMKDSSFILSEIKPSIVLFYLEIL